MSAVAGVMALAVLACNCAPLTNAAGALEGLIGTPGADLTPGLPEGAPAYPTGTGPAQTPAVEGNLPVHDGGDGRETAFVRSIERGTPADAAFESTSAAHNWVFEASAGETVTVRTALPPDVETDPILALIDPQGVVLATSDDVEGYNPVITLELPLDGLYTARLTTWLPGPYTVSVD